MNVVGDMLRIKQFRENRAEMEVSRTRHVLQEATQALDRARNELNEFRNSCERRERELYADMCSRLVRLTDINDLMLTVAEMQEGVRGHEGHVSSATEVRKTAVESLAQARQGHQLAVRSREKFSVLSVVDEAELRLEQQRAEDLEMEDIRLKGRPVREAAMEDHHEPDTHEEEPLGIAAPRRRGFAGARLTWQGPQRDRGREGRVSKKRMDVDMGTMALPVGEERRAQDYDAQAPEPADPLSITRFQQAMDQPPRSRQIPDLEDEGLPSPFALLGAPEPVTAMSAEDIGALVERLWVSDGAIGIREVRVTLQRQILPDTSVRLYEAGGRLQVALSASADATRHWLEAALPGLASDLGKRLNRPLRVTLMEAHAGASPGASCDWPEGIKR